MKHVILILLAVLAGALSSCSYLQRQIFSQKAVDGKAETRKELPPLYLGTVHQVYPAQKFALLRIIGPIPRAGVTLISHPADDSTTRMGNLVVSADSSPNRGIIVADIRSGSVASGDRIFLYRNISRQSDSASDRREDDVVTESPVAIAPPVQPTVAPAAQKTDAPLTRPQPAAADAAESRGVEVTTPPASAPQGPLRQPAMPNLPDKAPSYLNDIPDDINQWD